MTNQYSPQQFLRRTPNEFLENYFAYKGIDLEVDFSAPKAKEIIFQALINLPDAQQAEIETEFQNINALACEGGVAALIDESRHHIDDDFTETIAAIVGFHAKLNTVVIKRHDIKRVKYLLPIYAA